MRTPLLAATLAFAAASSHANNCDTIRAGIEARIRAGGVAAFTLQTVPADARVAGKVVGSCDLGTKKIVYLAQGAASGPATAPRADERILTECKDGSVSLGGDCRKP